MTDLLTNSDLDINTPEKRQNLPFLQLLLSQNQQENIQASELHSFQQAHMGDQPDTYNEEHKKANNSSARGRRFRAKQQLENSKLVENVGKLKGHVEALARIRDKLLAASEQTCAQNARTCIDILQLWGIGQCQNVSKDIEDQRATHMGFLKNMMHEHVAHVEPTLCEMQYGVESLMEEWTKFCAAHAFVEMNPGQVEIMQSHPTYVAKATSTMKLVFSHETLVNYYPNVLRDEQCVKELIGLEVSVVVRRWFYFNEQGKCVFLKTHMEFSAGIVEALESVEDAMELLAWSTIKEGLLKSWECELPIAIDENDRKIVLDAAGSNFSTST